MLGFSLAAAAQPKVVIDAQLAGLQQLWCGAEFTGILGFNAMFAFLNRLNDTTAAPLDAAPDAVAQAALGERGWTAGKHQAG